MLSYCPVQEKEKQENENEDESEDTRKDYVITDHKRDCIFRDCLQCGVVYFQEALRRKNPNVQWANTVVWHQWEKVDSSNPKVKKKSFDKIRYTGPISTLLSRYIESLHKISVHMFDFRWQAFQFEECKKQLRNGDCLFIIDFAQNYSHHQQDEILGAYWSRKQSTLHPFVIYYPCPEKCGDLVKEEVMILSDDLKHDAEAVEKFTDKVLEHLQQRNVQVERVIIFSDNCASQYKCAKYFNCFTKRNIPFLHNHFGAKHGKAEANGAIGRLSQHIDTVTRSGSHEFGDCSELAAYCSRVLDTGEVKRGMCGHYRKSFYEVLKFSHSEDNDLQTVKGTTTFHSIRNTGIPGIIEVRESSCFCEPCFLGEDGECKNKHLVKPYRWAKVCDNNEDAPAETLENKLWKNNYSSVKYKHCKIRYFKRKTAIGKSASKVQSVKFKIAKKRVRNAKKFNKSNVNLAKKCTPSKNAVKRNDRLKETAAATSTISHESVEKKAKCRQVKEDWDSDSTENYDSSDNSDFEEGIPLKELIIGGRGNDSVTSPISSRTRLGLNRRPFVRCKEMPEEVDLLDYDGDFLLKKKVQVRLIRVDDDVKLQQKLSISGIQPLLSESWSFKEEKVVFRTSTPEKQLTSNTRLEVRELDNISPIKIDSDVRSQHINESSLSKVTIDLTNDVVQQKRDEFTWRGYYNRILSCKTYKGLKNLVHGEHQMPPLPIEFAGDDQCEEDEIDDFSLTLIPNDVPAKFSNHSPVETFPEGNCFFRSLSRLVYGDETHHLEMRCRVVDDLVKYDDNYTSHEYLMRGAKHTHKKCFHIGAYYCAYSGVSNIGKS